jgi:hypothetical protein
LKLLRPVVLLLSQRPREKAATNPGSNPGLNPEIDPCMFVGWSRYLLKEDDPNKPPGEMFIPDSTNPNEPSDGAEEKTPHALLVLVLLFLLVLLVRRLRRLHRLRRLRGH